MSYWNYLGDLMRNKLHVDWPLPHIWALVYGLEALQRVVEKLVYLHDNFPPTSPAIEISNLLGPMHALKAATQTVPGRELKLRTGFLCRGHRDEWYWVLTRHNYKTVLDAKPSDISVLLNTGIPPEAGMIGALNKHILTREDVREEGGVFCSLKKNTLIDMEGYPSDLARVERENWPDDEFIGEFLLGFVKVDHGKFGYDLRRSSANTVGVNELAVVFVYCTGLEPLTPHEVFDAQLSISKIKQFFWRFLEEYGPALQDASDALVRSAVASIMARNMSHNIGSHVSTRTTMDRIKHRLLELHESVAITQTSGDVVHGLKEAE